MSFDELIELAKRRLNAGAAAPRVWNDAELDLAACVPIASHELSMAVMRDESRRAWLQQGYPVTLDPVTSEGDLLTAVGDITTRAGEIILEGLWFGTVIDADNNILQPIIQYPDFFRPQPTVFGYYTLKNKGKILTRALGQQVFGPADVQPASGPLTITANYTPDLVTAWPGQLTDDLVSAVVAVAVRKMANGNA